MTHPNVLRPPITHPALASLIQTCSILPSPIQSLHDSSKRAPSSHHPSSPLITHTNVLHPHITHHPSHHSYKPAISPSSHHPSSSCITHPNVLCPPITHPTLSSLIQTCSNLQSPIQPSHYSFKPAITPSSHHPPSPPITHPNLLHPPITHQPSHHSHKSAPTSNHQSSLPISHTNLSLHPSIIQPSHHSSKPTPSSHHPSALSSHIQNCYNSTLLSP